MAANVKLIRMLSGVDLVAELISVDDKKYKFKNPLRIVVIPSKTDAKTPTVGLAPWSEFSDDKEFEIDRIHVVCTMNPAQEFINQYNSIFGGIVAPSSKLIIPNS